MTIYDIVVKLIGPIDPVGETNADNKRYENLKEQINLVDKLLDDIWYVVRNKDSYEHSVKRAGEKAREYLVSLKENLDDDYLLKKDDAE